MTDRLSAQSLRRLMYFAAIADAGSISAGAEHLGLSVPTVSESLFELEAELGVTLATRSTRRFTLTEEGQRVRAIAGEALRAAEAVFEVSSERRPVTGKLSVATTVELAAHWLPDHLARFQAQHPGVELSVAASDIKIDLPTSPHDIAIRATLIPPDLLGDTGLHLPLACVARGPLPLRMTATGAHLALPLLAQTKGRSWEYWNVRRGTIQVLDFAGTVAVDNRLVATTMACEGMGAAVVIETSVRSLIKGGTLCRVLPEMVFGRVRLDALFRDARPSRAARAFRALLPI